MRQATSRPIAAAPAAAWDGSRAMPTVELPSRNRETVSLAPRPKRRCSAIPARVPIGRTTKASASRAKAYRMPSRRAAKGKNTAGNTSTEAMPKTKKSKYSEARPITTPTAMSPGAMRAASEELAGLAPWAPVGGEGTGFRGAVGAEFIGETATGAGGGEGEGGWDKMSNVCAGSIRIH